MVTWRPFIWRHLTQKDAKHQNDQPVARVPRGTATFCVFCLPVPFVFHPADSALTGEAGLPKQLLWRKTRENC